MLNEQVKAVLKESFWYLGTYGADGPNVDPVAFKDVAEVGTHLIGDVFLETTLKNIGENGKIAISASNAGTLEGYQIKGTAKYLSEGPVVDTFKKLVEEMFHGAATAKGALAVTPEKIIVTTPGPDNKKEL